jgi:hypothetical protein
MHRSKLYALTVLALLAMGAIVSVQANNGVIAPPVPDPNGLNTNPGGDYDGPPFPLSPQSGSKGNNPQPELVVSSMESGTYNFRVYRGDTHDDLVAEAYTAEQNWVVTTVMPTGVAPGLPPGTYSWTCRVNPTNVSQPEGWSEFFRPYWTFSIRKYSPPADGAVGSEKPWDPTIQPRTRPNPFGNDGTRIRMALPSNSINASAAVYSTEGRLMRKLNMNRGPDGLCEFPWDGKDETGRSVGAGTYLCQITAGDMHKVVELVKSR